MFAINPYAMYPICPPAASAPRPSQAARPPIAPAVVIVGRQLLAPAHYDLPFELKGKMSHRGIMPVGSCQYANLGAIDGIAQGVLSRPFSTTTFAPTPSSISLSTPSPTPSSTTASSTPSPESFMNTPKE